MRILNIIELKEQMLLMLNAYIQYSEQGILQCTNNHNSAYINAYQENIKKCKDEIKNIDSKIQIINNLISNSTFLNNVLDKEDRENIYVSLFNHNAFLEYKFTALKIKNIDNKTLCDVHFSKHHTDEILLSYFNINSESELFIALSSIKNRELFFYKNKIMTDDKKEKLIKSLNCIKHLSKQYSYYNTPLEINLISKLENPSINTKIRYLNHCIEDGELSIEKQLDAFSRYYNNQNIYTTDELKIFFSNVRQIRKYLNKRNINFNFAIDVITNIPPKIYLNDIGNSNNQENKLYLNMNKEITLEKLMTQNLNYDNGMNTKNIPYTFNEYLDNKEELDALIKLMQY